MKRKLAMWALCLITLAPRENISSFPKDLASELLYFKDEIENNDPFGGKVQLNPIPEAIKLLIKSDSSFIERLKTEASSLDSDKRIWTYP